MKRLLLAALLAASTFAHATTSVSLDGVGVSNVPVSQYGNWLLGINNWPSQYSVTQGGLWNVGQYGQWYVGQYGPWYMSLSSGSTIGITGTVAVTAPNPLTITSGGVPIPVSVVGGTFNITASAGAGTGIPISNTSTISGFSPATATAAFGLGMAYDANTSTWRKEYLASAGDGAAPIQFPGVVGYGVYNASGVSLADGQAARLQFDGSGRLITSTQSTSITAVPAYTAPQLYNIAVATSFTVATQDITSLLGVITGKVAIRIDAAGPTSFVYQVLGTGTAPVNMTTAASVVGFFHPGQSGACPTDSFAGVFNLPVWVHFVGSTATARIQDSISIVQ